MEIFKKVFGRERKFARTEEIKDKEELITNVFKNFRSEQSKYKGLASYYYGNQDYYSALNSINNAIEIRDRDDYTLFALKANILQELGEYKEAIEQYEEAIDYGGYDITVYALYHQIGICYLELEKYEKALEFFTYAIELKKQHPNKFPLTDSEYTLGGVMFGIKFNKLYDSRAIVLKRLNRLDEAIEDCKQAISYDASDSTPYLLLSQIYSMLGQKDNSLRYLKKSASLGNEKAQEILIEIGYI